ncbi:sodium:calcium antiporter [Candidatus Dojkabacteria bacterium]|uniref:Sodium:calcium antiporter n=1 Tax=Candidatus Dojkabacteria bacterium TaxID=2099670 RepID=A0A955RJV8_9BACT|nr:sodium:calcium antiporter [Candidatus Dojkabacteria bacterium]
MYKVMEEYFIRSLDNIAQYFNLSPSVAGATLMAFGTSVPELSIALFALFLPNAHASTGLGSVVGSAMFQSFVVIGIAAIVKKLSLDWGTIVRDYTFYAIAVLVLLLTVQDGVITFLEAFTLVTTYGLYLGVLLSWSRITNERHSTTPIRLVESQIDTFNSKPSLLRSIWVFTTKPIDFFIDLMPNPEKKPKATVLVFMLSLIIMTSLSYILVISSESIAEQINIPPAIIALTVLAGGSSLPELIGSTVLSHKDKGTMAFSNAIGSNVFALLVSFGLPVFLFTIFNGPVQGDGIANVTPSILALLGSIFLLVFIFLKSKLVVDKPIGYVLLFLYLLYMIAVYTGIL